MGMIIGRVVAYGMSNELKITQFKEYWLFEYNDTLIKLCFVSSGHWDHFCEG